MKMCGRFLKICGRNKQWVTATVFALFSTNMTTTPRIFWIASRRLKHVLINEEITKSSQQLKWGRVDLWSSQCSFSRSQIMFWKSASGFTYIVDKKISLPVFTRLLHLHLKLQHLLNAPSKTKLTDWRATRQNKWQEVAQVNNSIMLIPQVKRFPNYSFKTAKLWRSRENAVLLVYITNTICTFYPYTFIPRFACFVGFVAARSKFKGL